MKRTVSKRSNTMASGASRSRVLLGQTLSGFSRSWLLVVFFGKVLFGVVALTGASLGSNSGTAQETGTFIILQSTTSTRNSGLFDHILPIFEAKTGIEVRIVAVGTGQALRNAVNGDGDVVLVHATAAEEKFVDEGYGLYRADVMYNDFIIVGPSDDPARVSGMTDVVAALARIAGAHAVFASRGDDSGTNKAELSLWAESGIDPRAFSGQWYRETGSGMGATLNTGIGMGAYVMTDRATWTVFGNKGAHRIMVEGDPRLFNQYGIIPVSPARHPHVKAEAGQRFTDWMLSKEGQAAIAGYSVGGRQLFFPNAKPNPGK